MRRKKTWLLYPVLTMLLVFCLVLPASADDPVPLPHVFYGSLTIGTEPAPAGTEVEARDGDVMPTAANPITTTAVGEYGGAGPTEPKLEVQGYITEGAPIEFYVDGARAQCREQGTSAWLDTYPWHSGGNTELDLRVTAPDETPPTVSSVLPVADATDVATTTTVSVTFSEAMDAATITTGSFTLSNGGAVSGTVSYDSGTVTATFTPSADLAETTTFTATLSTAITDVAGNPLASAYSWSFTTITGEDTTPPTVSSVSPVADDTGVAVGTTVSVTFSEAMASATITTGSFTLDSVAGSVSYDSGTFTATFTPNANLSYSTTYTATLSTAITDVAGNPLASAYSWSFTTEPEVTIPGDANGDGVVDALDITKVERIVAGLDASTPGADANEDGVVNALDITKVERIIAGLD